MKIDINMLNKLLIFILISSAFIQLNSQSTVWDGVKWSNKEPKSTSRAIIDAPLSLSQMTGNQLLCQGIEINATITMDVVGSFVSIFGGMAGVSYVNVNTASPLKTSVKGTSFRIVLSSSVGPYIEPTGLDLTIPDDMYFAIIPGIGSIPFQTNDKLVIDPGSFIIGCNIGCLSTNSSGLSLIKGDVTVKQTGWPVAYRFNAWSSPLQSAELTTVFAGVPLTDIYQFADGGANTSAYTNVTGKMTPGRGYLVVGNGTSTREFKGQINNGDISVNLNSGGWVLLGNPYPGLLYLDELYNNNPALDPSFYFFADDNSGGTGYSNTDYATYNASSQTGVSANGSAEPTGKVLPCQGFFNESGMAKINYETSFLVKKGDQDFIRQSSNFARIWLNLIDVDSNLSEMAIVYGDSFLIGQDDGDSKKKLITGTMSIHTYLNHTPYVIQAYPSLTANQVIDLGVITHDAGVYDISIKKHENLPMGTKLILEDTDSNIMHDLSTGPYSVLLPKDSITGRFFIHIQPLTTDNSFDVKGRSEFVSCYYNSGVIFINGVKNLNNIESVSVYDLSGRLKYFEKISSTSYKHMVPYNVKGINIVQIRTKTGIIYKRIFI